MSLNLGACDEALLSLPCSSDHWGESQGPVMAGKAPREAAGREAGPACSLCSPVRDAVLVGPTWQCPQPLCSTDAGTFQIISAPAPPLQCGPHSHTPVLLWELLGARGPDLLCGQDGWMASPHLYPTCFPPSLAPTGPPSCHVPGPVFLSRSLPLLHLGVPKAQEPEHRGHHPPQSDLSGK